MRFNLTITLKALVLIAVPLLFLFVLLGLVGLSHRDDLRAVERILAAKEAIARLETVDGRISDAVGAVRAYIIAGNRELLAPYREARQQLPGDLRLLRRQLRDQPAERDRLDRIEQATEQEMAWLERQAARVASGHRDEAVRLASTGVPLQR